MGHPIWNTEGKQIATLKGHGDEVFFASFSPDGKMIATASADKTAKLWNWNGKNMKTFMGHGERILPRTLIHLLPSPSIATSFSRHSHNHNIALEASLESIARKADKFWIKT